MKRQIEEKKDEPGRGPCGSARALLEKRAAERREQQRKKEEEKENVAEGEAEATRGSGREKG